MMSKQDIDVINSDYESDHDIISTEMLEDILDESQTHPSVDRIESHYKICDCIRQRQSEWKGAIKDTQSTGKGLHKVFSTVVKDIFARMDTFGRIWFRIFPFHTRANKIC